MIEILVAVIGSLQAVTVAFIMSGNKRTKQIRNQVANDHGTNLRDELDERHEEIISVISENTARLNAHTKSIAVMRSDVDGILRGTKHEQAPGKHTDLRRDRKRRRKRQRRADT